MRKLILFALSVVAVLVVYRELPDTAGWDAALLFYTAAGLLILLLLMAVYTHHWTALGVGLLGIFLGAAILRGAQSGLYWGVDWLTPAVVDWLSDVVRALLATGTTWAVVGAIGYAREGKEPVDPDRLREGGP